uniref:Uncharacterized protein n=1 Tax=viral metagenome TaxID=1070528 RepID=A0A6M3L5Z8_9ZZZZ
MRKLGATQGDEQGDGQGVASPPNEIRSTGRSGGQTGNVNGVRHGNRSKRYGCVLPALGRRFRQPYQDVCRLRRMVEAHLAGPGGRPTLLQTARIQTLCRIEQSIRALEYTIRIDPEIGPDAIRRARADICTWSAQRDAILQELLGSPGVQSGHSHDPWSALDAGPPAPQPEPEPEPTVPADAPGPGEPGDWQAPILRQPAPKPYAKRPEPHAKSIRTIRAKVLAGQAPISAAEGQHAAPVETKKGPHTRTPPVLAPSPSSMGPPPKVRSDDMGPPFLNLGPSAEDLALIDGETP